MQSCRTICAPYKVKIDRILRFQQNNRVINEKNRLLNIGIKPQNCSRKIGHSLIREQKEDQENLDKVQSSQIECK